MDEQTRITVVLERASLDSDAHLGPLAAGRELASAAGGTLTALMLDAEGPGVAADLLATLADEVVVAQAPWLAEYEADAYLAALAEACRELEPRVVLMAHDATGREVAPRLAARLRGGLATDCTAVRFDAAAGELLAERPCFSGKAVGEWALAAGRVQVATLRRQPNAEAAATAVPAAVSFLQLSEAPAQRVRVIDRVVPPPGQVRLEDAEVIVGVGRGVGSREAFEEHFAKGLAPEMGAACGGSRGAVDMGIIPADLQIGLTGHVISPRIYIAVGLSGSPQHMAGCSGAQTIVAVNTDPAAPIFNFAHHGVVGDYRRVLPSLVARLKELRPA